VRLLPAAGSPPAATLTRLRSAALGRPAARGAAAIAGAVASRRAVTITAAVRTIPRRTSTGRTAAITARRAATAAAPGAATLGRRHHWRGRKQQREKRTSCHHPNPFVQAQADCHSAKTGPRQV